MRKEREGVKGESESRTRGWEREGRREIERMERRGDRGEEISNLSKPKGLSIIVGHICLSLREKNPSFIIDLI